MTSLLIAHAWTDEHSTSSDCTLKVPFASNPNHLIIPMGFLGFGIGMVDSSMMPELANLVDLRHSSSYGGVYAIGDIAFCLGFAIGPALSGNLVKAIGFKAMLTGIGLVCILYGPLLILLKNPPPKTEQEKQEAKVNIIAGSSLTNTFCRGRFLTL